MRRPHAHAPDEVGHTSTQSGAHVASHQVEARCGRGVHALTSSLLFLSLIIATDRDLAHRIARDGDPHALDLLYRRHSEFLFTVARRGTRNSADAEDAVHDTFMRATAGMCRFRGDSSVRTWLVAILRNRLREAQRRALYECASTERMATVAAPEPTPTAVDPIDLSRALDAMPRRYQEVLLLHDLEGFTHEDISRLLGIAVGTSKSQLTRGRRWLRERLDASSEPCMTRDP